MRVANLNTTDPNQQCPESLQLSYTDQPIRLCGRRTSDCDSVILNTYGVQYQQVCGRVRGYQSNSPDAFNVFDCPVPCTIDNHYVDGVSITHGASPRKHIWTYAAGYNENGSAFPQSTCPCTGRGASPPDFLGSDYYCESGFDTDFCKKLPEPTTGDLEFRICRDQSLADEDTPIDLVQLYIQ